MWTTEDLLWLTINYPGLKQITPNTIEGRLSFQMLRLNGKYFVEPEINLIERTNTRDYLYICDTYSVRITWENDTSLPTVFETGGKLSAIAERLGITNLADMHQFQDTGAVCLASHVEMKRAFAGKKSLDILIEQFIIPYFFAQSYFAKHKKWLWGDLSHGIWGLIEWLGRKSVCDDRDIIETFNELWAYGHPVAIFKLLKKRCRGYWKCSCKSGKKIRECHPDRQLGMARIRGAISRGILLTNT